MYLKEKMIYSMHCDSALFPTKGYEGRSRKYWKVQNENIWTS